ncbi:glycosyltransferase family 2 protein [Candidatus Daviesbacteria bacterium]|nr:glycosyltransferase family 2 protein [Candidatus Daviesbacteria bacterium]
MINKLPSVSIIFPNFNGGKEPLICLASVQKLNYPQKKLEIIVVDNASSDKSDQKIKARFPLAKLVKLDKNYGFAKAVNIGIRKANGEFIFVANDDLIFEKNSLLRLVEFILKDPKIGVLGGKIYLKSSPKKITSCGYMLNKLTGNVYKSPFPNKITSPDWVQGCAMLIPKKVFKKIGLFDSGFKHLFEDVDFCFRAKRFGLKVLYLPEAIFWHGESVSADKNLSLKYFNWYMGKLRFLFKHMPIINVLSILFIQIFIIMPYRSLILRDNRGIPFLKALIYTATKLPKIIQQRQDASYI